MPASMLQLPRELYLDITNYLTPAALAKLARVSKDHYFAVQEPLYARPSITAWAKLVILVRTLTRAPIVSSLSAEQRLNWHKLTDERLRERHIRSISICLTNSKKTEKVTGADLSRMIGAISRSSYGVKIELTLYGPWLALLKQLQNSSLQNVCKLTMYLGCPPGDRNPWRNPPTQLWEICFGGSIFPDLCMVDVNTVHSSPSEVPKTLRDGSQFNMAARRHCRYDEETDASGTFCGLKKMTSIKLNYNTLLDSRALQSLFGSSIIPGRLTKAEITNCPSLDQTHDLAALSTLLQRGLQQLQHLKLHLQPNRDPQYEELRYSSEINSNPDHHLCNVVRCMGQQIKHLDLALPFACADMFVPVPRTKRDRVEPKSYPHTPREPSATLPQRLLAEGYKHRRLIVWHGVCRARHDWMDMKQMVNDQGERISWEIVSNSDRCATWRVHGCLPLDYPSDDVLRREVEAHEI